MKAYLAFALVLGAAAAFVFWLQPQVDQLSSPGKRQGELALEVTPGTTIKALSQQFEQRGLIADWRVLYGYARVYKLKPPKAGEYAFAPELCVLDMLAKMARGEVQQYTIGFPEGLNYKEIAARLETTGFVKADAMIKACEDRAFLQEHKVPGVSCEGYLFPDTYKIVKGKSSAEITAMLIARHHEVFAKSVAPLAAGSTLTAAQIVTLASIVEKETGAVEERPHIAGLFLNRLAIKMPLATDPTVIYALMLAHGSFDGNIHKADLSIDHPYNTYRVKGLPPGPISNPGLAALLAVVKPMKSDDLFFVSKNNGTHAFCPTYACHEAQVKKWQIDFFKNKRARARKKK